MVNTNEKILEINICVKKYQKHFSYFSGRNCEISEWERVCLGSMVRYCNSRLSEKFQELKEAHQLEWERSRFRFKEAEQPQELFLSGGVIATKTDNGNEPWPYFYARQTKMREINDQVCLTANFFNTSYLIELCDISNVQEHPHKLISSLMNIEEG